MWVEIEIPDDILDSVLASGLRIGIAYWARLVDAPTPAIAHVEDVEGSEGRVYDLTPASVADGLELMSGQSPEQFGRLLAGNGDARTGDVLIQWALFGEVRYG